MQTKNNNTDAYYIETEGLDYVRFPLIKPFDATSGASDIWILGIGHDTFVYSDNIYEITVLKNFILVHSIGVTIVDGDSVQEGWYVFNTTDKEFLKKFKTEKDFLKNYGIEKYFLKGFETEKEFSKYLKSIHIDEDKLVWQKPADLYKQFKETGCLPWIPNCK
jgi:hypothetical protein